MLHPAKTGLASPIRAAAAARRRLLSLSRPSGSFDASRYFRGADDLRFLNVGTATVRQLGRAIAREHGDAWGVTGGLAFAAALVPDRYLEVKGVAIELLARFHGDFTPRLLTEWKRWLAANHSANWATTDTICGALIGPLLLKYPSQCDGLRAWARHRNMWVRRASIVGLIHRARRGESLDLVYDIARRLHGDREDLIQKAVGWALREAGKTDMARLERYLRAGGAGIPRTTLRYAIERFPEAKRRALLAATR